MQLLEAARSLAGPRFTPSQAVAMALPSTLEGRVRAIVDERRDRRAAGNWSRVSAAVAVIAAIAGSAFAGVKSSPPKPTAAPQVLIEVKFIEAPDDAIDPADFPRGLALERADVLLKALTAKKGVDILSAPRLTTRSGQRAVVEIGGGEPGAPATGFNFDVLPSVRGTGPEIELELVTKIGAHIWTRLSDGKPVEISRVLKTNVTLTSGRTCIGRGHTLKEGRTLLIAVTASIVDDHTLAPPKPAAPTKLEYGKAVQGKEGFVTSPYAPEAGYIDARGFPPGTEIKDPYTGKIFLVPARAIEIKAERVHYDTDKSMTFAEGNVVFSDGTAKITGNSLRYDTKKRKVEVTGSARVERGGNVATCEKIIYWLDTGKMQTEGLAEFVIPEKPAQRTHSK